VTTVLVIGLALQSVEFHNLDCRVHKNAEVIIDPENKINELTKFNNRVAYRF